MSDKMRLLARPFPQEFIEEVNKHDTVPHHVILQRLILIFGTTPKIEILRETYDEGQVLSGVLMRLTVPGHEPVEEWGAGGNPQSKTNGDRAKDACSDALKRCAMRLGCGLHLWAQGSYFLYDKLKSEQDTSVPSDNTPAQSAGSGPSAGKPEPQSAGGSPPAGSPQRAPLPGSPDIW